MTLRDLLSPASHFELRRAVLALQGQMRRVRLWRWELVRFTRRDGPPRNVFYAGTRDRRWHAAGLLAVDQVEGRGTIGAAFAADAALVSEAPVPGALRIPWTVHAVVPLGRSADEILATYDVELRRRLRKQRADYSTRQVTDAAEIVRINATMLAPYATERHADSVKHLRLDTVATIARGPGRLDLLLHRGQPVGCHLGYPLTLARKRHWINWRLGYPSEIFSDPKRLRDVNSMNVYTALQWAIDNGFDHYDLGGCVANPMDGLLQWKRRRGGAVDALHSDGCFFVRLPRSGAAQFLWDSPLFSLDGGGLALRLGLPAGPSDDEAIEHFREMGFGGLIRVCVHCARQPGERLLASLRGLFERHDRAPAIETILPMRLP